MGKYQLDGREGHRIVRRELALEHVLCERNRLIALIDRKSVV